MNPGGQDLLASGCWEYLVNGRFRLNLGPPASGSLEFLRKVAPVTELRLAIVIFKNHARIFFAEKMNVHRGRGLCQDSLNLGGRFLEIHDLGGPRPRKTLPGRDFGLAERGIFRQLPVPNLRPLKWGRAWRPVQVHQLETSVAHKCQPLAILH